MKKIKRVLLINPPDTRPPDMLVDKVRIGIVPPLGLAYIGAVLELNGFEVEILDCVAEGQKDGKEFIAFDFDYENWHHNIRYGMEDFQISNAIKDCNPDLVGVSCLFSNKAYDAHNVCRLVKEVNPEIITVMGGSHPTAMPIETLKDKNVDYVNKGEGEIILASINEILKSCDSAKTSGILNSVDVYYTVSNAYILKNLPFPARHLLNMPKYLYSESPHSGLKQVPATNISTSRGCPGRCSFCAIRTTFGDAYRVRSPENVLSEIEHLINTYHIKELHFEDDNLTANKKRAMTIFQGIIDRQYNLSLNSPSGLAIFAMDEELLEKMVEAGYYSVSFAIESGVPWVLRNLMHKNVDLHKAKRLTRYARALGLKVKAFFILGYPGETKETMLQTVDFAGELGADWSLFFPATNLPGTEMDRICRENNWLVDPNLDYRYYFYKPNIRTPEFEPGFVIEVKEEANRLLNFKNNINIREGKLDRAIDDFTEVLKIYPHLEYAQEALRNL